MIQNLPPCPHCGRQPVIELCEPWSKKDGPQPWYAGCYLGGGPEREHFVGANGATRKAAEAAWCREVKKYKPKKS